MAYRAMKKRGETSTPQQEPAAPTRVRDAGPESMRDKPNNWGRTDERSDQSFPASDPPSTY
jgi:hypothetical protein